MMTNFFINLHFGCLIAVIHKIYLDTKIAKSAGFCSGAQKKNNRDVEENKIFKLCKTIRVLTFLCGCETWV